MSCHTSSNCYSLLIIVVSGGGKTSAKLLTDSSFEFEVEDNHKSSTMTRAKPVPRNLNNLDSSFEIEDDDQPLKETPVSAYKYEDLSFTYS